MLTDNLLRCIFLSFLRLVHEIWVEEHERESQVPLFLCQYEKYIQFTINTSDVQHQNGFEMCGLFVDPLCVRYVKSENKFYPKLHMGSRISPPPHRSDAS